MQIDFRALELFHHRLINQESDILSINVTPKEKAWKQQPLNIALSY